MQEEVGRPELRSLVACIVLGGFLDDARLRVPAGETSADSRYGAEVLAAKRFVVEYRNPSAVGAELGGFATCEPSGCGQQKQCKERK
jgi:hypothetical protein